MIRLIATAMLSMVSVQSAADAKSEWDNVARIVAVGDVHGDYASFATVLKEAGVIDEKGKWAGGRTHLVQVGDVADRGPDTRRIMDLLMDLEKSARKAGGRVHALIGNHEAMNIQGDLRYVHPGEYAAFVDRRSKSRRDQYAKRTIAHLRSTLPEEEWPDFEGDWRTEFDARFPLGYVEHRLNWAPGGKYGKWVLGHNAIIRINDTLFVHGGLAHSTTAQSLTEINTRVRTELAAPDSLDDSALVNAPDGPLWNRTLAVAAETDENAAAVESLLARFGAKRIVIAHTPRMKAVLPRLDARVVLVDVGLAAHYGGANAFLVIEGDDIYAVQRGKRLDLPADTEATIAYLERAAALEEDRAAIDAYIDALRNPPPPQDTDADTTETQEAEATAL